VSEERIKELSESEEANERALVNMANERDAYHERLKAAERERDALRRENERLTEVLGNTNRRLQQAWKIEVELRAERAGGAA
jgi:hypothetical protein